MQASDKPDGNQGLPKAELENIFEKPQPKVAGSHRVVVSNRENDVAVLHLTFCLSLSTVVIFYHLWGPPKKRHWN